MTLDLCRIICVVRYINALPKDARNTKTPYCFDFFDWIYAYEKFNDNINADSDQYTGQGQNRALLVEWPKFTSFFPELFREFLVSEGYTGICSTCNSCQDRVGAYAPAQIPFIELNDKGGARTVETYVNPANNSTFEVNCAHCKEEKVNCVEYTDEEGKLQTMVPQINATFSYGLSKYVVFRLPMNQEISPKQTNEKREVFEATLEKQRDVYLLEKVPTFLVYGTQHLHLQSVIEYNQLHYTVRLLAKSNSRLHILCNDRTTQCGQFCYDSQSETFSPSYIKNSHPEMVIYECISKENFLELAQQPLTLSTPVKRNRNEEESSSLATANSNNQAKSSSSVQGNNANDAMKQKSKSSNPQTTADLLSRFFSNHAQRHQQMLDAPSDANMIIQPIISFILSKPNPTVKPPEAFIRVQMQTGCGFSVKLDEVLQTSSGIKLVFILFVKSDWTKKATPQNAGITFDISFYCNGSSEWDWNMGRSTQEFSAKHGSADVQYQRVINDKTNDSVLKFMTDQGILFTFDLALKVLSGTFKINFFNIYI
jgi:hypothetical protein